MQSTKLKDTQCLADDLLETGFNKDKPGVTPALHPSIKRFLDNKQLVFSLMDGIGSPLNIIFPDHILENIDKFEQIYKDRHLQGRIFYTSKPNKSQSLKRRASMTQVGLDVSSEGELKNGLASGFHSSRIEATGPKSPEYLFLGIQHDILINVDNFNELKQIVQMHGTLNLSRKVRILVRLDGFKSTRVKFTTQDSAFGIRVDEAPQVLDFLVEHKDVLDFQGFSFHFNAGDYIRRPVAIEQCLELTFEAMNRGLSPKGIDIGGGYRIRYAASQDEWNAYVETIKASVLGERDSLTWNDSGLGFRKEDGLLKGAQNFMEHWHKDDGAQDLASVIDAPLPAFDNQSLATILSESLLELYVEPGRAMLDHCGVTMARVNLTKPSLTGENLVSLGMNRTNLNSTQLKLMTDPYIIYRANRDRGQVDNGVFYVGNLCLTHDMIQYQKTFPKQALIEGDVVTFINTAAYQMDFAETMVLQQPLAQKVAITETSENEFSWSLDEKYNPVLNKMGGIL
tara:strand:- start:168 stop:1700 length:1533 start_codon:yes stop_codon:yes gene_type:complete